MEQYVKHSEHSEHPEILEAIEELAAELARVEPGLDREEARGKIRKTVRDLLRDAGTVA